MDYSMVVASGRLAVLKQVAELITDRLVCKVITHPSPGMIMIKHTDPLEGTPFFLGEAFATQCEVETGGNMGYGCVLGDEPERALYGAIIDSVLGNGLDISGEIIPDLEAEKKYILDKWSEESKLVSKTKVDFDIKKG